MFVVLVVLVIRTRDRVMDVTTFTHAPHLIPNASLVLIEGGRDLQDTIIRTFTGSKIVHVGLVCRDATGMPFLLHTSRASGTVLVPFLPWLKGTPCKVYVRESRFRVSSTELERAVRPLLGLRYTYRLWKAVLRKYVNMELPSPMPESTGVFCSELVAEVLARLGVLDFSKSQLTPSLVLPAHFGTMDLPFSPNSYADAYSIN